MVLVACDTSARGRGGPAERGAHGALHGEKRVRFWCPLPFFVVGFVATPDHPTQSTLLLILVGWIFLIGLSHGVGTARNGGGTGGGLVLKKEHTQNKIKGKDPARGPSVAGTAHGRGTRTRRDDDIVRGIVVGCDSLSARREEDD